MEMRYGHYGQFLGADFEIENKLKSGSTLSREEERELLRAMTDCFNPAWQLDVLLNYVAGLEKPEDVKGAIASLIGWRDAMLKRAKRERLGRQRHRLRPEHPRGAPHRGLTRPSRRWHNPRRESNETNQN
jgi:hypothetical protein